MNKNDIDSAHLQLIDKALQSTFPSQAWAVQELVGGGLSTSVLYKIGIGERAYLVRLSDPTHPHNNLSREYSAMQLAAEAGLAPHVHYADAQAGIAMMDFVEGRSLNATSADGLPFVDSLARIVRRVHHGKSFQKDMRLTDKVEFIFSQMRSLRAETELVQDGMIEMRKLAPFLNDPDDERPSHCDINPGNLLFDGSQLWLVDWAAATQENFYFDLACCSNFFFFQDSEVEEAFLHAYFERSLTSEEAEKYARMRTFVAIYYGIMFLYLSGMQNAPLLSQQEIDTLPAYPQFLARVGQGVERMDSPATQQRLGFVYLKEAQERMSWY